MSPGFVFDGEIQMVSPQGGVPVDWPVGTSARMRVSWGTGTEIVFDGTIDGSYLRFHLTAAETELIPRGALVTVDVNYNSGDPDMWRPWRQGTVGRC